MSGLVKNGINNKKYTSVTCIITYNNASKNVQDSLVIIIL